MIIKAAAGGGGRGMNVVRAAEDLERLYQTTRATAQAVFKDSAVYIERYLEAPRHIEVQLVCDSHGNGVHLFERDCSVQRRHQKLIEEAPSIHLSDEAARRDIGERAVQRRAVGRLHRRRHDGVPARPRRQPRLHGDERPHPGRAPGDRDDHRLDLIQEQIRVAAGEPLSVSQDDVDPARATRSSAASTPRTPTATSRRPPGGSTTYVAPGGPWTRVDSHCYPGWTIAPVLRLADRQADRLGARTATRRSSAWTARSSEFEIEGRGVKTTIPFHQRVLADERFRSGDVSTDFVEHFLSDRQEQPAAAS